MTRIYFNTSRGQTLVEFAFIIPIFLLLTVGFLDLGRAVYYYSAIHNAAREGARYSVVQDVTSNGGNPPTYSFTIPQVESIEDVVRDKAVAVGLTAGIANSIITVDQTPDHTLIVGDKYVYITEVCVEDFPFTPITPFIAEIFGSGNTIDLTSCSLMQMER